MKQKDIALILIVSFIGIVLAIVVSNFTFNSKDSKKLKSDVVTAITTEFNEPDKRYFNKESIDPTQIIRIGENTNQKPFNQ
jgi:hypothetical protein